MDTYNAIRDLQEQNERQQLLIDALSESQGIILKKFEKSRTPGNQKTSKKKQEIHRSDPVLSQPGEGCPNGLVHQAKKIAAESGLEASDLFYKGNAYYPVVRIARMKLVDYALKFYPQATQAEISQWLKVSHGPISQRAKVLRKTPPVTEMKV